MRQGEQAKSLEPEQFDRGSTRLIGIAFILAILVLITAPILNVFQIGRIGKGIAIGWAGIGIMLGGLALRLWANQTLGQFYTSTLRIAERQRIIRQGPYKVLRHPGYGGLLLTWAGAGLATENWIAATIIILVMFISYHYRIISEEAMLLTAFGEQYLAQLQSAIGSGRNDGPRLTDNDRLEAHQAFLDLKFGDEAKSRTFRVGRHEMDFGAGQLISAGEGLNVRRSFDGLRVIYRQGPWLIKGQINKLVSIKPGLFNDGPDSSQTFWGVGATRSRPKIRGGHQYKGEKLFDIAFIIVKVRRNAHRVSANADKNLGFRQTLAQAGRGAAWQSYPDHVINPVAGRKRCAAQLRRFPGDQPRQRGERMLDIFNLPFENLPQCGDGHRRQDEIGEFAHVKPARARPVFVPVINQAREILAPGARKP